VIRDACVHAHARITHPTVQPDCAALPDACWQRLTNNRGALCSTADNAWLVGLALWIPVQVINFRWVPVAHQASFVTFIATAWKTFLSIMFHREEAEEEETTAATTTEELRHPSSNSSSGSTGGKPGIMSDDMEGHGADAAAVHRLVQEQQAEIDRLRLQTAEMHQLRAELEQLRSHVQRKPPSMQPGAVGG
jgi:hypothetical protein